MPTCAACLAAKASAAYLVEVWPVRRDHETPGVEGRPHPDGLCAFHAPTPAAPGLDELAQARPGPGVPP